MEHCAHALKNQYVIKYKGYKVINQNAIVASRIAHDRSPHIALSLDMLLIPPGRGCTQTNNYVVFTNLRVNLSRPLI